MECRRKGLKKRGRNTLLRGGVEKEGEEEEEERRGGVKEDERLMEKQEKRREDRNVRKSFFASTDMRAEGRKKDRG